MLLRVETLLLLAAVNGRWVRNLCMVHISAAATNALRMQQRVGTVSFTREFLARLLLEDSCHYLFYAILFLTSAPVTMALLPISLFAGLHAAAQIVSTQHFT